MIEHEMKGRGRPSRAEVFASVDAALRDLNFVGGLPMPIELEGIWRDIWHDETHHSTAIEGNTLVFREVEVLLEEGRALGSKELTRYLEVQGYAEAARWVYQQAIPRALNMHDPLERMVSETEVRRIHQLVIDPVWRHFPPDGLPETETPGSYRQCEIEPLRSGHIPISHPLVPAQLANWLASANDDLGGDCHPIEQIASLHAAFERIHPFRDGNGRVGRLLLNLLLVRHSYPPAIILKRDREKYLRCLERADSGETGALGELLARSVKHSIERFLIPALAGPHRFVPITSLANSDTSHVALLSAARRGRLRAVKTPHGWYSSRQLVDEYLASRRRGARAAA